MIHQALLQDRRTTFPLYKKRRPVQMGHTISGGFRPTKEEIHLCTSTYGIRPRETHLYRNRHLGLCPWSMHQPEG